MCLPLTTAISFVDLQHNQAEKKNLLDGFVVDENHFKFYQNQVIKIKLDFTMLAVF